MKACFILLLAALAAFLIAVSVKGQEINTSTCFPDWDAPVLEVVCWSKKPRGAVLFWTPPATPVTGYRIYRREVHADGTSKLAIFYAEPDWTIAIDHRASPQKSYVYTIVAVNECGESGFFDAPILTADTRP